MGEKRKPLRWKIGSRYAPTTYILCRGGEKLATVQRCDGGWFWYNGSRNTAGTPNINLDACKADVAAWMRRVSVPSPPNPDGSGAK